MELNVFVNKVKVGCLKEIAPEDNSSNPNPRIQFSYLDSATAFDIISLCMPVARKNYIYHEIPPVFDMILPEGVRRQQIALVAKATRIDDMGLLAIVGYNTIGRVQVCQGELIDEIPVFNLRDLMHCTDGEAFFNEILQRSGFKSGVAGVQPKFLAAKASDIIKFRTVNTSTHIIKSFNPQEYPWLTVNEFFCLKAAQKAGIEVPKFFLSQDGLLLAIQRFDIKDESVGTHYGFEEMVSLLGRKSAQKYDGCIEELVNSIDDYIAGADSIDALQSIFRQTVFNVLVGNGDAHLKNFGLLYDESLIRLAPAYDIVCTKAYIENDIPALALEYENYSKRWWSKGELIKFSQRHCFLDEDQVDLIYKETIIALEAVMADISDYILENPAFSVLGNKMLAVWRASIKSVEFKSESAL